MKSLFGSALWLPEAHRPAPHRDSGMFLLCSAKEVTTDVSGRLSELPEVFLSYSVWHSNTDLRCSWQMFVAVSDLLQSNKTPCKYLTLPFTKWQRLVGQELGQIF